MNQGHAFFPHHAVHECYTLRADLEGTVSQAVVVSFANNIPCAIPHETYTPGWRDRSTAGLRQVADPVMGEPVAALLARVLQAPYATVHHSVTRAQQLASLLVHQPLARCVCHGDIHAGNVLMATNHRLSLVDWETLVMAPTRGAYEAMGIQPSRGYTLVSGQAHGACGAVDM